MKTISIEICDDLISVFFMVLLVLVMIDYLQFSGTTYSGF